MVSRKQIKTIFGVDNVNELKTLKDFEKTFTFPEFKIIPPQKFKNLPKEELIDLQQNMKQHLEFWCHKTSENIHKDIKQEAIKWIKEIRRVMSTQCTEQEEQIQDIHVNADSWIIHFFELDEDDLK